MAYAVDTPTVMSKEIAPHAVNAIPFACNVRSDDISGCEEIKATPGAGKKLVITQAIISSAAAITITIGEGETGGAVTTAIWGPVTFAANQCIHWVFKHPVVLTANKSLTCDASGAGVVNIFIEGYTI